PVGKAGVGGNVLVSITRMISRMLRALVPRTLRPNTKARHLPASLPSVNRWRFAAERLAPSADTLEVGRVRTVAPAVLPAVCSGLGFLRLRFGVRLAVMAQVVAVLVIIIRVVVGILAVEVDVVEHHAEDVNACVLNASHGF